MTLKILKNPEIFYELIWIKIVHFYMYKIGCKLIMKNAQMLKS
jgi:hypothetical protein